MTNEDSLGLLIQKEMGNLFTGGMDLRVVEDADVEESVVLKSARVVLAKINLGVQQNDYVDFLF